jgi:hypothetical protein
MERGFFAFPVEIERALPTSTTTPTTTATTVRLISALSSTQPTTESLPTSSTRLEVVEDVLKGFNITHLTEFEGEYPNLDFTPEIKTENPNLFNPEEASIPTDAQLPTAEMETLSQMVFFIFFCMMTYIMHKILIRVYTEAVKELERASFFEREMPYTIFCLWVYQGLGKVYPPIWCSKRSIRRKVLADLHEHLSVKAATLNSLSQAQTPNRRRQAAPDDSEDSDDAYVATLKSIKDSYLVNSGRFPKGTPHPTKSANKDFEFQMQVPKRGTSAAPRMVSNLPPEVVDYDLPCDQNQTSDPIRIWFPNILKSTKIMKRLSEVQEDPGYITGSKSQSSLEQASGTPPGSRPVPNLSGSVTTPNVMEIPADQQEVTEVSFSKTGLSVFSSLGATGASSMQGEQECRDLSVTIDPTRLGARPKTPKAPILKQEEEDDLSEKATTEDKATENRMTIEAEVHPDRDAQLEAKMNAEFVKHMTEAANKFVSSKNAEHLRVLKEVTFSPIQKRGTPGLSSTGNSELTSSTPSSKTKSTPDLSTSNEASRTLGENLE